MINLSSVIFTWWQQQQQAARLFASVAGKRTPITIHQIVNLNNGKGLHYRTDNTLALLHLVRKRGALTPDYLEKVRGDHQVSAWRILRAWQRSNKR